MGLYAGLRPIRAIPGVPLALASPRAKEIDFVLVRESVEGLFASRDKGIVEDDRIATERLVITRDVTERLSRFCFNYASGGLTGAASAGRSRSSKRPTCSAPSPS